MPYKVVYHYDNGETYEDEEIYRTEDEANEAGLYGLACYNEGGEILEMSNPGDYPWNEDEDETNFEVIEI